MRDRKLPKTSDLTRMTDLLRRQSEALLVVVIRTDDVAFSVDPGVSPRDFGATLEDEIPALVEALAAQRSKKGTA